MGVSNRELILDNLNTALSALITAPAPLVQVSTVERCLRSWDDPQAYGALPWVGFCSTRQTVAYEPYGHMVVLMEVDVWAHVADAAPTALADRTEQVSNLSDMLIGAISADPTRGGAAISTTLKDTFEDDGHPDFNEPGMNISTLTQRWEVKYLRTVNQTT